MPKKALRQTLGICLDEKSIRLAQVGKIAGRYRVDCVHEHELEAPFGVSSIRNPDLLDRLSEDIFSIITGQNMETESIAIAVSPRFALIKRVPCEPALSQKEMEAHVLWELGQYIVSPIDEYRYEFQTFPPSSEGAFPSLLFVGIRNSVIEALETIAKTLDLSLQSVTVENLAQINLIEYNYELSPGEKTALIEIGDQGILFTLMDHSEFIGHRAIAYDELNGSKGMPGRDPEGFINHVSKHLRFLFDDYWSDDTKSGFDNVLLTRHSGEIAVDAVLEAGRHIPIQIVQPFRKIAPSENLQRTLDRGTIFAEYIGAIGSTLTED